MNYQEKEDFLKSYKIAKENAEAYQKEIANLRETMLPSGMHLSDVPKHHNNTDDHMADYAGEFWEIQRRLDRATARMVKVVAVINQIDKEDPLGHRILVERYINNTKRAAVCKILYISGDTEWRHRKKAIERLKI